MGKVGTTRAQPVEPRFWKRVRTAGPADCWQWLGGTTNHTRGIQFRYGRLRVGGRYALAHRISYGLANGPIPEGLIVMHACDNPLCVNPAHLVAGTQQDNMQDCLQKGRWGHTGNPVKLTDAMILAMRQEYVPRRMTYRMLGRKYGVCKFTAFNAVRGYERFAKCLSREEQTSG